MEIWEQRTPIMDFTESFAVMTIPVPHGSWRARPSPRRQVARLSASGRFLIAAKGAFSNALETVETAVDAAVARWMHLKITKDESDYYGIQVGLPRLKGFVCHCELEADTGEGWPHHTQTFV
jgi:hypothetical protein